MLKRYFGNAIGFLLRGGESTIISSPQLPSLPEADSVQGLRMDSSHHNRRISNQNLESPPHLTSQANDHGRESVSIHREQEEKADKLHEITHIQAASAHHIWALGIVTVIGGQYFSWNTGLEAGIGSFSIAVFITGSMYLCLVLCLAEMNSAIPFAGGAYGFARVTLGTYVGYVVGCCESLEYIMYVAISVISLGRMITSLTMWPEKAEPVYWIVFYATSLAIHMYSGKKLWVMCWYCAVVITFILVLYCLATTPWMNFKDHAALEHNQNINRWLAGGGYAFMKALPQSAWLYVGVESLPLASAETQKPRVNVPAGMIACIFTLLLTSLGVLFCSVSLPPGIEQLSVALFPLNYGFAKLFRSSLTLMSILTLPAVCATAFGFMFAYGRQMYAMARSGLFPEIMSRTLRPTNSPYVSLSVGSFASLIVCVCGWRWVKFEAIIFPICMIGAYCAYMSQFLSFIVLRVYYPNLKRQFNSPLGMWGALYGFVLALISLCAVLGFQDYQYESALATVIYVTLATTYYRVCAQYTQKFSPEEQSVMFVVYVIKDNIRKAKARSQPHSSRSSIHRNASVVNMATGAGKRSSSSERTFSDPLDVSSHRAVKLNSDANSNGPSNPNATATPERAFPTVTPGVGSSSSEFNLSITDELVRETRLPYNPLWTRGSNTQTEVTAEVPA